MTTPNTRSGGALAADGERGRQERRRSLGAFVVGELYGLAAALMFFTRLPGLARVRADDAALRRAITYFPVAGWVVGGSAALVWSLASLVWPAAIASGLSLVATLLVTGALHEDGWADVCDGFGGGHARERILAIMKDSHVGVFGVIGLVGMLGLKWQAVAWLPAALAPVALVAAHSVSRGAAAALMAVLEYARPEGEPSKARPLVVKLQGARLVAVVALTLLPMGLLPVWTWSGVVAALIGWAVMARWFAHRLGGYTGDCLGATQQFAELIFYLTLVAIR
ncbi:MAG TPA: adenosylcobinamide-GDP ribazoletransferase [Opitutaceae bacterium]